MPRRDGQPTEEEVAAQRRGEGPPPVLVGAIPPAVAAATSLSRTTAATAAALAAPPAIAPVVAVGAINAAAAGIIGAFDRFLTTRRTDQEQYVNGLLEAEIPDLPEDARLEVVDGELEAEKAYAAKMRARLDHDLPLALSISEAAQREAAVQAILDRERHYMELRENAMASRALGAAEQRDVELKSPEGGYWRLSPHVKQHTIDCVAMGNKVWPHSVLRSYHPPLHGSCPCEIWTVDRAREAGLIGPDSFQSHDQSVYALQIAEAAWDEDELAEEMVLLEAAWEKRWWKGTEKAGQFRPKRGGDPGAVLHRRRGQRMNLPHLLEPAPAPRIEPVTPLGDHLDVRDLKVADLRAGDHILVDGGLERITDVHPTTPGLMTLEQRGLVHIDRENVRGVPAEPKNDGRDVKVLSDDVFPGGVAAGEYITSSDPRDRSHDETTQLVLHAKVARDRDHEIVDRLAAAHSAAGLPRPDLVVAPPADRGKPDRFEGVRAGLAQKLGARTSQPLYEVADIPGYRDMTVAQRRAATAALGHRRFEVTDDAYAHVHGRSVLLVDDVVTSGEQARSIRDALISAGASDVRFVALAHARSAPESAPASQSAPDPPTPEGTDAISAVVNAGDAAALKAALAGRGPSQAVNFLREHGLELRGRRRSRVGGAPKVTYTLRGPDGSTVKLTGPHRFGADSLDKVEVVGNPQGGRRERLPAGQAPRNLNELLVDALGRADEIGQRYDAGVHVSAIVQGGVSSGAAAHHEWNGTIAIRKSGEAKRIREYLKRRNGGEPLNDADHLAFYGDVETLQHEINHGVAKRGDEDGGLSFGKQHYRGFGKNIEEALTEETGHLLAVDWLRSHGMTDVLAAVKRNPQNAHVTGVYRNYRVQLKRILDDANVPEGERAALLERMKFQMTPEERNAEILRLAGTANLTEAMHGEPKRRVEMERNFEPILRPDLSDIDATETVTLPSGRVVAPGQQVVVRDPAGDNPVDGIVTMTLGDDMVKVRTEDGLELWYSIERLR